jgi:hypothetical protein
MHCKKLSRPGPTPDLDRGFFKDVFNAKYIVQHRNSLRRFVKFRIFLKYRFSAADNILIVGTFRKTGRVFPLCDRIANSLSGSLLVIRVTHDSTQIPKQTGDGGFGCVNV